jgi:putative oxidoreductase
MSIVDRFSAQAPRILAIFRFIAGAMFACNGAMKLFGFFGGMPPGVPPLIKYVAGTIEFFGGILIAIGLFTRITAFISSGLMACAYFMGHAGTSFWPIINQGGMAIMNCWFFLYLAAAGPGAWALDNLIRGARGGVRTPPGSPEFGSRP